MRGFRNVGDEEGLLHATAAGTGPGGVQWRDDVFAEDSRRDHRLDKDAQIIEAPAAAE